MGEPNTQKSGAAFPRWVIRIQELRKHMKPIGPPLTKATQRRRMHRLPPTIHRENEYKPYRVSLGPWWDEGLAKEVKLESLLHFLYIYGVEIACCYDALREVVDELMDAYDGLDQRWRDDTQAFLEMMLLDGCFLLEFIRTNRHHRYFPRDPDDSVNPTIWRILENGEEKKCYVHDLLLLENQLPVTLLSKLLGLYALDHSPNSQSVKGIETHEELRHFGNTKNIAKLKQEEEDKRVKRVQELVLKFLEISMITFGTTCMLSNDELESSLNLLDVYRKNLLYHEFRRRKTLRTTETCKFSNIYIPSATKLLEVGLKFTTNTNSTSLLDIHLQRNTLKLPEIVVDASTKSTFLNLLAFEQLHKNDVEMEITTYTYIMGRLVQSAEDASLLQSRGVITTALHAAEVANLFHGMSKNIPLDPDDAIASEYVEMLIMLRSCYNKMSNEWRKDLSQIYLRTPWKIMSIMAASLILILSFIQTIYTVLSYVNRK